MRAQTVWKHIGDEARARAARDFAHWIEENGFPAGMAFVLARALRFRESTISKAKGSDLERLLLNGSSRLSADGQRTFLVSLHDEARKELRDRVVASLDDLEPLLAEFELQDLRLCLATIELTVPGEPPEPLRLARELVEQRAEQHAGRLAAPAEPPAARASESETEESLAATLPADGAPGASLDSPEFTTLDKLLIRAVVSSVNGVEGALDVDELRDLVEEVVALNDVRSRSWLHLGYLAALRDEAPADHGQAHNRERRGWYLAGHLLGRLRKDAWAEVWGRLEQLSPADHQVLLGPGGTPGGTLLANQLVPRLLEADQVNAALRWIDRYGPMLEPALVLDVLDWAKRTISRGEATAVRQVLEALAEALPSIEERAGSLPPMVTRLLQRRLAVSWRCEGRTEKAQELVDRLLASCDSPQERARLEGEQALIAMGLRSLEELALPEDPENRRSLIAAIEAVRPQLEAAEHDGAVVPSVSVALSLPAVAAESVERSARDAAIRRLRVALEAMGHDAPGFWDRTGLDVRARFYLSVLELRSLDERIAPSAVDRLRSVLETDTKLPFDLASEAIGNALVCETGSSDAVARLALVRWPRRILLAIGIEELVQRSAESRKTIVSALRSVGRTMTIDERWRAWEQVLRGALAATDRDVDLAAEALDQLELLGRTEGLEQRFLALLDDSTRWDPAWTTQDAQEMRVRLLERLGRTVEARGVLFDLANLAISNRDPDAADLIDWIATLGAGDQELEQLRRRIAGAEEAPGTPERAVAAKPAGKPVHVLFVGGNETQERYEGPLRAFVSERYPGCTVGFVFSGWSANWGPLVKRLGVQLGQADAVVLMRFVRTQLGRTVRRKASELDKPWIACSGHGRESLERAISTAILVARKRAD